MWVHRVYYAIRTILKNQRVDELGLDASDVR